ISMNFQPSRWIGTRTERMVSMKSSAPAKKCRRQCSDSPPRLKGVRDCSAGRFPTRNLNLAARPAGLEAAEPVGQADADGVALQFRRMSQHRAATRRLADRGARSDLAEIGEQVFAAQRPVAAQRIFAAGTDAPAELGDRKSTRLNSSH